MKKLILVLITLIGLIGSVSAQMSEVEFQNGEKYFLEVQEICFYDNCTDKRLIGARDYWLKSAQFYYKQTRLSESERFMLFYLLESYDVQIGAGGAVRFTYEAKQYPYNKETICVWIIRDAKYESRGCFYRGK